MQLLATSRLKTQVRAIVDVVLLLISKLLSSTLLKDYSEFAARTQEEALSKEQLCLRRLDHIKELQELYKVRIATLKPFAICY